MTVPPNPVQGILLTLAYAGGPFHGFVVQANARSVAGELLAAARKCDPHVSALRCVSRTDAGVHARCQLVAFDTSIMIPLRGWVLVLNRGLPDEVSVRSAIQVPVGFDPRRVVKHKWYRYVLLRDRCRDPFLEGTAWRVICPLDLELARKESESIVGTHDFAAFRSAVDARDNTIRTITSLSIHECSDDPRQLFIDVCGTGFMHNMVRIIVGSLYDIARGKLPPGTMGKALATKNRSTLGITAPAHGLCLMGVELDMSLNDFPHWP
ncbi:MAG: tRNA pseudouridine(38-40) synthase TruA [Polyangiaceae bacterium]|nr:tRNA pseudouridine(38-40) synthase TruA [Polyangiaceae bacterium]